jgi:hypothetical protein
LAKPNDKRLRLHQYIGQLDMYVRMFDDLERKEGDNPTIGILLCTETDRTIAKYSVLNKSKQGAWNLSRWIYS